MSQSDKAGQGTAASRALFLVPLVLFLAMTGFLARGLFWGEPEKIPSVLIGKPAPEFDLPPIVDGSGAPGLSKEDVKEGGVAIVNFWASWCGPCRIEHPLLMDIARTTDIPVYGINQKNVPAEALRFLEELGNPYTQIGADRDGRAGIDFGVYGLPETFVINEKGDIIYKHVGPIRPETWRREMLPLIKAAREQAATEAADE